MSDTSPGPAPRFAWHLSCTYYNLQRTHQGYRLKGRTPAKALRDALGVDHLPSLNYAPDSQEKPIDQPEAA